MSNALTILNQESQDQGGVGIDFGSKLFELKPATINIVQPNSQTEGAIKGKLRITETGDQFSEMFVTLLRMPVEQRAYYVGEGSMNRTPDNLTCFSRDMYKPDVTSRVPQALLCASCARSDWETWRQDKRKENIPPCDAFYHALMVDTVYKMPLQMYIRSKSKGPFEAGMQNLAREFAKMKAADLKPSIFDIGFTLSTTLITTGKFSSYVLKCSDFKPVEAKNRKEFGEMYLQYASRNDAAKSRSAEEEADDQINDQDSIVQNAVSAPEYEDAVVVI
jgi:hypothetical protein